MKNNFKNPIKIGVTGGIGTGKTTVCNIFKKLGIPVFNTDDHSKILLQKNEHVINNIVKVFGDDVLDKKKIDTKKLGRIVFTNKKKLVELNNILHPRVIEKFDNWLLKQNAKYIIKESAILFESNTHRNLDQIILIQSPLALRLKRVCARDNRSKNEVSKIIKNQLKESEFLKLVDHVITNDEKTLITPQVMAIHKQLSKL
ncbi:MAG: dephospho-CoA kinase [Flavobacteriales bacterium]|nr:dephospho-CoA kinase [Flavobacteriales bacterium]